MDERPTDSPFVAAPPEGATEGAFTPPAPSSLAFCSAMASESIPRDPARGKPPGTPSPVVTGEPPAGSVVRAGGDAPKPYVAFPAQEFARNGRPLTPPDEGEVPKPKSRRGGAGASVGEKGEGDALVWLEGRKGPGPVG